MDAQKIMDEIGVFLDRSLLKKSKITKAEIIRFIEEKWAETDEPSRAQSDALEFLKQNQEEILTGILTEILKNYPKWQKIYDYPSETKSDFMPDICAPQELSELLELQNIYILDGVKIGFEFSCSWDMEHGLGVMTRKGNVMGIGESEVAFGC